MNQDNIIISGFRNNDQQIINSFYKANFLLFINYFKTRYGKTQEYIVDLFQDSCVILWQNIHDGKLREDNLSSSLSTYLLSIGKYTMMAKDRKYKEILDDNAINNLRFVVDDADELKYQIERENFIDRAVSSLKSPCNELLRAFYWDKLSGQQIALKLGYGNPDSVKTQKNKCMNKLKQLVSKFPR